ncbi:MAG: hypothetical protein WCI72_01450 [archaeon]
MNYHIARLRISVSRFFRGILEFFEAVTFYTKQSFLIIKTHEKTQSAKYHLSRAKSSVISSGRENAWNWNHRLTSSESFRIFDEDV